MFIFLFSGRMYKQASMERLGVHPLPYPIDEYVLFFSFLVFIVIRLIENVILVDALVECLMRRLLHLLCALLESLCLPQ